MLRAVACILACLILALATADVFFTVVLARRSRWAFRITRLFYGLTWAPFKNVGLRIESARVREDYLSIYGPLSLPTLLACWMLNLVIRFGLLHWVVGLNTENGAKGLLYSLYYSGAGLFTVVATEPQNQGSKILLIVEAGLGISILALVVGYLPVLYQSFSSRELGVLQLDARAGSPPSAVRLLTKRGGSPERFEEELETWETWEAEFLQAHTSYPMLAYFRSQHLNQSWLSTITSILDASAIVMLSSDGDLRVAAELTFAMGRHALVDITRHFQLAPCTPDPPRLSADQFQQLCRDVGRSPVRLEVSRLTFEELSRLAAMYEPYAHALSEYFVIALPAWQQRERSQENWQVAGPNQAGRTGAVSDPFAEDPDRDSE